MKINETEWKQWEEFVEAKVEEDEEKQEESERVGPVIEKVKSMPNALNMYVLMKLSLLLKSIRIIQSPFISKWKLCIIVWTICERALLHMRTKYIRSTR